MRRYLNAVIPAIILLTILGAMLLVQTNSRSSILIKESVYVAGAALALLACSVSVALTGKLAWNRISIPLILSFILLMAWLVFRHYFGVQSVNGPKYIYSTLSLGAITFIMAGNLTARARDMILWVLVVSTALLSVYALLQSMGVIIFSWDAGLTQSARSSGTMGNANLLGSFSMAMIPVGAGFLLSRLGLSRLRYLSAGVYTFLCTGALLASKTRGSLLGIAVLLLAIPLVPSIRRNRKRLFVLLIALMVLMGISVIALSNRIEELGNTSEGTLQVRKLIWSGSLSMWLSNPVLGYGPGSFQIVFPEFRDPDYFLLGVSHNTLHAHCEYIEILVDSGIIGLLLWSSLAASVLLIVRRNRRSVFPGDDGTDWNSRQWTALGLAGGILALLAEAMVSVALRWPPSALLLALFTGLLLACIPAESVTLRGLKRYGHVILMTGAAVFLALVALPGYFASMKAGGELFVGKDIYLTSIQVGVDNAVNSAMEWSSTGNQQAADRAIYYFNSAREVADSSRKYCERCVITDPDELGGWYALGSVYVSTARLYQQISPPLTAVLMDHGYYFEDREMSEEYMVRSLAAYDSLRSRAPDYAEVQNNLTLVWINLGNADSALAHMRRAWDLHAHNRIAYMGKVRILNPLTRSVDGVYIKWQANLRSLQRKLPAEGASLFRTVAFDFIIFDFGTTFYLFPEQVDSLKNSLQEILTRQDNPEIRSISELVELQVQHLDQGLEMVEELEAGDTAGVMARLSEIDPEVLRILPVQNTLLGMIQSGNGDLQGTEILCQTVRSILWNGIDELVDFPVSVTSILEQINLTLFRTGLDEQDERYVLLRHLKNMLDLDRSIFEVVTFIESSSALLEASRDVHDGLREIWARIGGPLYSYMEFSGEDQEIPIFAPGSLIEENYSFMNTLVRQDSLDADMLLMEIEWLFLFFGSSYSGVPHFSTQQAGRVVSMLADSRDRLVELLGESEAQYRLGWMLTRLYESDLLDVTGEFSGYLEALRSDLTMGRIARPDLP